VRCLPFTLVLLALAVTSWRVGAQPVVSIPDNLIFGESVNSVTGLLIVDLAYSGRELWRGG